MDPLLLEIRNFIKNDYPNIYPASISDDGALKLEAYNSCSGKCDVCPQQCVFDDSALRAAVKAQFPHVHEIVLTQAISDETLNMAHKILGITSEYKEEKWQQKK